MLHLEKYKCVHSETGFPISFSNSLCLADYESVVILITSLSRTLAGSGNGEAARTSRPDVTR